MLNKGIKLFGWMLSACVATACGGGTPEAEMPEEPKATEGSCGAKGDGSCGAKADEGGGEEGAGEEGAGEGEGEGAGEEGGGEGSCGGKE